MREVFPVSDPQDAHGRFGMEHLGKLVNSLHSRADLIVIQSPAVSESAESYMVCAVADRTLLVAGAGSSADSVLAARDQMERVGVSLLGVAFVERPSRRRAESGSDDRTATMSGPDAPNRPNPTQSARWATSSNSDGDSRVMDMDATAPVGDRTAHSMDPAVPTARQVTTGDTGEETGDETLIFVNGQVTEARSRESAAAPDASSKWLDKTTSRADPKSRVSQT
jgi:hypothetical protein